MLRSDRSSDNQSLTLTSILNLGKNICVKLTVLLTLAALCLSILLPLVVPVEAARPGHTMRIETLDVCASADSFTPAGADAPSLCETACSLMPPPSASFLRSDEPRHNISPASSPIYRPPEA
jgi:hypothetical protein